MFHRRGPKPPPAHTCGTWTAEWRCSCHTLWVPLGEELVAAARTIAQSHNRTRDRHATCEPHTRSEQFWTLEVDTAKTIRHRHRTTRGKERSKSRVKKRQKENPHSPPHLPLPYSVFRIPGAACAAGYAQLEPQHAHRWKWSVSSVVISQSHLTTLRSFESPSSSSTDPTCRRAHTCADRLYIVACGLPCRAVGLYTIGDRESARG